MRSVLASRPDQPVVGYANQRRGICEIRYGTDGSVVCWGDDMYGRGTPLEGEFSSVSVGSQHTCGIRTGGSVVCWGSQARGLTATGN